MKYDTAGQKMPPHYLDDLGECFVARGIRQMIIPQQAIIIRKLVVVIILPIILIWLVIPVLYAFFVRKLRKN